MRFCRDSSHCHRRCRLGCRRCLFLFSHRPVIFVCLSVCLLVSADCVSFSVTNSALLLLFCHILPHFSLLKMARRERERKNETAAAATDGVCALEKKKRQAGIIHQVFHLFFPPPTDTNRLLSLHERTNEIKEKENNRPPSLPRDHRVCTDHTTCLFHSANWVFFFFFLLLLLVAVARSFLPSLLDSLSDCKRVGLRVLLTHTTTATTKGIVRGLWLCCVGKRAGSSLGLCSRSFCCSFYRPLVAAVKRQGRRRRCRSSAGRKRLVFLFLIWK